MKFKFKTVLVPDDAANGPQIRAHRERHNKGIAELAEAMGVTGEYVRLLELGKRRLKESRFAQMKEAIER